MHLSKNIGYIKDLDMKQSKFLFVPVRPRNWVAKNQKISGAGRHTQQQDRRNPKHRNREINQWVE